MIWQCTFCCRKVEAHFNKKDCPVCGNRTLCNPALPHRPHWSRKTLREAECLICERVIPTHLQGTDNQCPGKLQPVAKKD